MEKHDDRNKLVVLRAQCADEYVDDVPDVFIAYLSPQAIDKIRAAAETAREIDAEEIVLYCGKLGIACAWRGLNELPDEFAEESVSELLNKDEDDPHYPAKDTKIHVMNGGSSTNDAIRFSITPKIIPHDLELKSYCVYLSEVKTDCTGYIQEGVFENMGDTNVQVPLQ